MSSHADTIRRWIKDEIVQNGASGGGEPLAALDAFLAENQRLRDALERSDHALRALLAGKPVRDADEILAANAWLLFAALDGTPSAAE